MASPPTLLAFTSVAAYLYSCLFLSPDNKHVQVMSRVEEWGDYRTGEEFSR